ncbi:MAG TPA: hypothetical protein VGP00_02990 [Nocardioides sp.]|jgi:drug/metabolite transporter (DMT)-like permease|nr:hypothetical protein [Nocardioides sp.]
MSTGQVLGLAAGLAAALLFGLAAVAQAHAVRRFDTAPEHLAAFVLRSVRDPWTLGVVVAYLAGFVLHAVAIWLLPLYLAQAAIAMSLPVTAVTSTLLLHERLTPAHWSAIGAVTVGLVLLSAGSGDVGSTVVDTRFAVAIWLGVAVLAVAGLRTGRLGGGVLGALAGLGYAGSAMAVRGVGTPVEPAVVACAAAVGLYGLLAFWLYSLGLDRAPVSTATAPLIVGQTFVPGLAGVLLLGDGVRPGWWPAVVAGLLLSVGGAIFLSRDSAGPDRLRTPGAAATGSSPGPAPQRGR